LQGHPRDIGRWDRQRDYHYDHHQPPSSCNGILMPVNDKQDQDRADRLNRKSEVNGTSRSERTQGKFSGLYRLDPTGSERSTSQLHEVRPKKVLTKSALMRSEACSSLGTNAERKRAICLVGVNGDSAPDDAVTSWSQGL
jgi:hypothetical protein